MVFPCMVEVTDMEKKKMKKKKEKTIIYFCIPVLKEEQEVHHNWYSIDPTIDDSTKNQKKHLSPLFQLPQNHPSGFSTVALDNKIYVLGGFRLPPPPPPPVFGNADDPYPFAKDYLLGPQMPPSPETLAKMVIKGRSYSAETFAETFAVEEAAHDGFVLGPRNVKCNCRITDAGDPRSDAIVIDTLSNDLEWMVLPRMTSPKSCPKAIAVNGLIYVMGSYYENSETLQPWIEVFSPSSQTWSALPSLPPPAAPDDESFDILPRENFSNLLFATTCLELEDQRKILVGTQHPLKSYLFDVETHKWSESDEWSLYAARFSNFKHVVVENVLYMLVLGELLACDFKSHSVHVSGLEDAPELPERNVMEVFLFHIGDGMICALWSDSSDATVKSGTIICLKFQVFPHYDEDGKFCPSAVLRGCNYYSVDGSYLYDCVAMIKPAEDSGFQEHSEE